MILHSDRKGNDCIWKLRCHCIQIFTIKDRNVFEKWNATSKILLASRCVTHFSMEWLWDFNFALTLPQAKMCAWTSITFDVLTRKEQFKMVISILSDRNDQVKWLLLEVHSQFKCLYDVRFNNESYSLIGLQHLI